MSLRGRNLRGILAPQVGFLLMRIAVRILTHCAQREYRRIAAYYALPVLINQSLDSDWFRALVVMGTIAFALSGVVLAATGQYSLFGALILATLPALGGGIIRDLLLQRDPIGVVRSPEALLIVFSTAPSMGTPKCASSIAGTFGRTADTVSPGPTPRRPSADASRRARRSNSR